MNGTTMLRRVLTSGLAVVAIASSLTTVPAGAEPREGPREERDRSRVELVQVQSGRYGPFATMRRANEVASYFRGRGYSAHVYPEWGSYYVNVW
jgi:hypothetical protein